MLTARKHSNAARTRNTKLTMSKNRVKQLIDSAYYNMKLAGDGVTEFPTLLIFDTISAKEIKDHDPVCPLCGTPYEMHKVFAKGKNHKKWGNYVPHGMQGTCSFGGACKTCGTDVELKGETFPMNSDKPVFVEEVRAIKNLSEEEMAYVKANLKRTFVSHWVGHCAQENARIDAEFQAR